MLTDSDLLPPKTLEWLAAHAEVPPNVEITVLEGGNANAAFLLRWNDGEAFLRTPPDDPIDPTAHEFSREYRLFEALQHTTVPAPRPLALCNDRSVPRAPFMLMEHVEGVSLTDTLPSSYGDDAETLDRIGRELITSLAELHRADWRHIGLRDFGRPTGFLDRQIRRWQKQYERNRVRDLPVFNRVKDLLERHHPGNQQQTTILHGDFHLDNALFSKTRPELLALIDFEMATIGDPFLDVGLVLALWGERPIEPYALPRIQAISRRPGAPTRWELAAEYERVTGWHLDHLSFYMALSLYKLASVIEGAYALYCQGKLRSDYARELEYDVPRLLEEAEQHLIR